MQRVFHRKKYYNVADRWLRPQTAAESVPNLEITINFSLLGLLLSLHLLPLLGVDVLGGLSVSG
jgi:hypothetical protein